MYFKRSRLCWPSTLETVTYGNLKHEIAPKTCTDLAPPDENKVRLMNKMKDNAEKEVSGMVSRLMYE